MGAVRLAGIKRVAAKFGITIMPARSGSSHWRAWARGKSYPITAHNGLKTPIPDRYIVGLCRCFDLDEAAFRRLL